MDAEVEVLRTTGLLDRVRDEEFLFSVRGWPGTVEGFVRQPRLAAERIPERARLLAEHPGLHSGWLPEGESALRELALLAGAWTGTVAPQGTPVFAEDGDPSRALGRRLEPDWVILTRGEAEEFRVVAGAVCFPTGWDFASALGGRLSDVHAVVPGLNGAVGGRVERLLRGLKAGQTWERINWGISLSRELNQHPARALPKVDEIDRVERAWLRLEWQALSLLPESGAVWFGIRPLHLDLAELAGQDGPGLALARQWRSMPEEMRRYKGLSRNLEQLERLLGLDAAGPGDGVTSG